LPRDVNAPERLVAESLLGRIDEVVATMRDRILDEEADYQHLSKPELDDVTELLYANAQVLALAVAGRQVAQEELAHQEEHVRRRVRTGIPLEAVLQAYRTAMNGFWQECTAEVVSRELSRDAAVELARKISEAMDLLTTQAAAVYLREESRLRALGAQPTRDLVEALLRGDVDPERSEPFSSAPGLDPQADLVVAVGRVASRDGTLSAALERAAAALADCLATRRSSPLLVVRERAIVAVAPAGQGERDLARLRAARAALLDETGIELYCGLSSSCRGFSAVPLAFEQASLAVSRASEDRPVVSLTELPALQHLLLGATGTTRGLLVDKTRVISDLGAQATAVLRETVLAHAKADMNVTQAAASLRLHENTVRYRLRRIREQTGHDPRTYDGLVELTCLLEILDS
jgi:hypothetical protein